MPESEFAMAMRFAPIFMGIGLSLMGCRTISEHSAGSLNRDFHSSVFVIGTNHILTEDINHWGTAFLVDAKGTIVTANHVVKDLLAVNQARRIAEPASVAYMAVTVFKRGTNQNQSWTIPVDVVMQRDDLDLAILRPINANPWAGADPPPGEPFEIDSRKEVPIGEPVMVVGYPIVAPYTMEEARSFSATDAPRFAFSQRIDPIVTQATLAGYSHALIPEAAIASGLTRDVRQSYLLLDHASAPGNSGGPVVSKATGRIIGVQARTNAFGYSFAVKAFDLNEVLEKYYSSLHQ